MPAIRLSPTAAVTPTDDRVLLRSDLGAFQLDGADVSVFVTTLLPLLDGSRDREAVAGALTAYSRESVLAFLALLERHGLIEEVSEAGGAARWHGQDAFFAKWTERPAEVAQRLRSARVLIVGLEPWGVAAAAALAASGVGALHLLDSRAVGPDDLLAGRAWRPEHTGQPRAAALAAELATIAPWTRLTSGSLAAAPGQALRVDGDQWDLVLAATAADDLLVLQGAARYAHERGLPSLSGYLDGLEAIVGPAVSPGQTACWNCYRLRRLAHAEHPDAAHALQAELLTAPGAERQRTYLAPTAGLLGHLLALEAIQLLTRYTPPRLFGRVLVQHVVTLESALHTVVRMPWCEVCGGAAAPSGGPAGGPWLEPVSGPPAPADLGALRDPQAVRETFAGWVDEHAGVIRYLVLDPPDEAGPELPLGSTAVLAAYTEGAPGADNPNVGSGKGLTAAEAMVSAVGEAIERYSASRIRPEAVRRACLAELDGDVLDPRRLCLYRPEQYAAPTFPFSPFDPDRPLDWVRGEWLDDGAPVWLPALPTYMHFRPPPDEYFCQVSSNGLAAGRDLEDAALRATAELVERDAFMLTWLAQTPARRVLLDATLDPAVAEVVRQLGEAGARIELYLLDVDAPFPAFVCVGFGDGKRWPGATVSLAAHANPRLAARKAILEQAHVGPFIRRLMRDGEQPIPESPDAVHSLTDHALFYVPPERAVAFDFLRAGGRTVPLAALNGPARVTRAAYIELLRAAGLRVAFADVTAPDVATSPLRVARALGPDMQPIDFGWRVRRLANPRLDALLRRGLNPYPHPLA